MRHIQLQGQPNFRDLGGYRTADGRAVARGEVYRSGGLAKLTDEDLYTLQGIGIRTVVSLLSSNEIKRYGPDRVPDVVQQISLSIKSESAAAVDIIAHSAFESGDFSQLSSTLIPQLLSCLVHDGRHQYAKLLRLISVPANRPLVFHCSQGIVRTGAGAAILLSALGVPWNTVRADYLLSNEYWRDGVKRLMARVRQTAAERQGILPEDVEMTNVRAFLVQDGSYIDAAYSEILSEYGSIEDYLCKGLELNTSEVEGFRTALLG